MRFRLSDEQELLRRTVRRFAQQALDRDRVRRFDEGDVAAHRELLPAMAELGFMSLAIPAEHGGLGGGALDTALVMEELGRASIAAAVVLDAAIGAGCELVARHAQAASRQSLFDAIARGEMSFALADGMDSIDSIEARVAPDGYRLHAERVLVRGAGEVHRLLVAARAGEASGWFLLSPDTAGIVYRRLESIGLRAAGGLYELDLRAARAERIADLGDIEAVLDRSRLHQAAYSIGCAQQVIDDAVRYAQTRAQFGQPIARFQAIAHLLVDLQVEVDAARALLLRAAWTRDHGRPGAKETAMAKLAGTETLLRVTSDAMRVYGGYGLTLEFDIQRPFRDARHLVVETGTSAEQRRRIALAMGLR